MKKINGRFGDEEMREREKKEKKNTERERERERERVRDVGDIEREI
jgi:hypothetical protein